MSAPANERPAFREVRMGSAIVEVMPSAQSRSLSPSCLLDDDKYVFRTGIDRMLATRELVRVCQCDACLCARGGR